MDIFSLGIVVLLFVGIAFIVQNPFLILGFGVGTWLFSRGLQNRYYAV